MKLFNLLFLLLMIVISPVFCQDTDKGCACQDDSQTGRRRDILVTRFGKVYIGMAKRSLRKAGFRKHNLVSSYAQGNEEWITFSGRIVSQESEVIIFHIKNGKVKDWIMPSRNFKENLDTDS